MTPSATDETAGRPVVEADADATYTVDILARLSGVSSETILAYHEHGLLHPAAAVSAQTTFDDESLRRLRRLESVRQSCAMNLTGLCLVARLLDEVERLREDLRARP